MNSQVSLGAAVKTDGPNVHLRIVPVESQEMTHEQMMAADALAAITMSPEMSIHLAGQIINAARAAAKFRDDATKAAL